MAILNIDKMGDMLNRYDSKDWIEKADFDDFYSENFESFKLDKVNSPEGKKTFGELLSESLNNVNDLQNKANSAIQKLVSGESKNIHETVLAVEKAEIAFKMMNQIRLKVVDAYKEVIKMQI